MNSQNQLMQSETLKNLMRAFAGESQARNRYTIAAAAAEEQNQHLLAEVFRFTARQEKEHAALLWQKMAAVSGQNVDICGGYPVDTSSDIVRQLRASVGNERAEAETVYPSFAKTARDEGFTAEAMLFEQLAKIERGHAERFERFCRPRLPAKAVLRRCAGMALPQLRPSVRRGVSTGSVPGLCPSAGVFYPFRPFAFPRLICVFFAI